ncbi:2,4-dihydroxyhept-2-ene-1,7-dioic acid aldolase [Amycolatopsis acidicola]|uniref:2,4-dihydroxyhept-2-ene-1,7-dioic acid aldolase n=1 Tax=Amycolatopsis acidicola TaxID=2596893 RepID=A0A5N0VEI8_9PSEU|nr:aldolase/citrate lyase family protein [Amycolatopsis acidicola]KAA9163570.1 2,4-dihydroxyhept-2-ene-1,7-dioic acid aldolase [Amycolatopsis acidicola]
MTMFANAGVPVGTWLKMAAPEPVEIAAHAGFDFVVVDLEHAPLTLETAYRLVNSAAALGMTPLVRVPDHTPSTIQKILDAGAAGVLVPKVDSVEQAVAVARATRFPPDGDRGAGGTSRAGRWGLRANAEYTGQPVLCIPQLESEKALAAATDILALPGVDAVFVGAADLSMSMGTTPADPAVAELITRTIAQATAAGKPCGLAFGAAAPAAGAIAQGCGFVVVSNDTSMLATAARSVVAEVRA